MKATLNGTNSRLGIAKEKIREFKDIIVETKMTQRKQRLKKKNEQSTNELSDNFIWPNKCVIGVFKGEEREVGT